MVGRLERVYGWEPRRGLADNGIVVHWNGRSWSTEDTGARLFVTNDIWGRPGQGIWIAGANGAILHRQPGP